MLFLRNVSFFRTTYLFLLNVCGWIVYGRDAVNRGGDHMLNSSEVTRIRRINSELEVGPKEWESSFDSRLGGLPDKGGSQPKLQTIREVSSCFCDAAEALAGDSLTEAFTSVPPDLWNFMLRSSGPAGIPYYFVPLWLIGVWVRYCILLPIRVAILMTGTICFFFTFALVTNLLPKCSLKTYLRKRLICFFSSAWVASLGGIVRYHGKRPQRRPNQIYVGNHTSMVDAYLLVKDYPFSLIGQRHGGIAGALQDLLMSVQSHVWFDRNEGRDRRVVQSLIRAHVENGDNEPIMVFPEGTCVNNEYCIMFKKGCFDLGADVYPIAIKYSKQFSDPYWNSSQMSFARHLFDLMTSWALVADVYYLEPQRIRPGETAAHFAARVKRLICEKADLIDVNWDGFLKRNRISPKFKAQRQKSLADVLMRRFSTNSASAINLGGLNDDTMSHQSPSSNGNGLRIRSNVAMHIESPLSNNGWNRKSTAADMASPVNGSQ